MESAPPGKSAWERAAVIVDVYNPSNEDSPQESRLTSIGRILAKSWKLHRHHLTLVE